MKTLASTLQPAPTLQGVKRLLYKAPLFKEILNNLGKGQDKVEFVRSAGSLPAVVASGIVEEKLNRVLYVAPDIRSAERTRDDLRTLIGEDAALLLPPRASIPYDPLHQNTRFDERAGVFESLISGNWAVIIVVASSLVDRYETIDTHKKRISTFHVGDEIDRDALALVLIESGMKKDVRAEIPGSFAVRGSVVDIYPPSFDQPVRLELWGDEITEIRKYDPVTQRSANNLEEISFYIGEQDEAKREAGIWELLGEDTIILIDDPDAFDGELERAWEEIEYQFQRHKELEKDRLTPRPDTLFHRPSSVYKGLSEFKQVIHRGIAAPTKGAVNFNSTTHESYMGDLERLSQHLHSNYLAGKQNIILCERPSQVDRLEDLLFERGAKLEGVHITVGALHAGFDWPNAKAVILTDHQIFGRHRRTSPYKKRKVRFDPKEFEQLKRGDIVVHTEFGIGKYLGPRKIKVGNSERECLQIEYRDGVKVYIKLNQLSNLQKYQGTEGITPKLSKIGGSDWKNAQNKTQKAVEEMAEEILDLYARRQLEGGHPFSADTPWQREMEAAFEFQDTPDQATTSEEIKRDMEKPVAMDRLLCGDVGFGKTEVAIRAAFKAVQDSFQVAILVPTTILAQQHYVTLRERLLRYPIKVEVLSRFRTRKDSQNVVEGLKAGNVDIVIGTHRLLSKDIKFKNLGLLIIDEEHRFGVKHKQQLKQLRASVDVLTMSATPIPRTLNMALSGAKDMSMISTPPHDRLPIETEVVPFDERVIREAIMREVARGGQVYFLHNRVGSIEAIKHMLERIVPGIKTGIGHGQMSERELEKVMDGFLHEKFQVLICTMIIESGLDIPNVNTLIVNRADRLGLAQLYQLRGRIGRSHRQAFAYLLTPPRLLLSNDARKRLETIAENTRLGSGFQIAMRDLEIRGAGNILGPQQNGFINAVGFEHYTEMLADAVKKLSAEKGGIKLPEVRKGREPRDVRVDLPVDAMLPPDYVTDASERVELYRRLSRAKTSAEVSEMRGEVADRFGKMPEEARHLFGIVRTQNQAALTGIKRVDLHYDAVFLEFVDEFGGEDIKVHLGQIMNALEDYPVEFKASGSNLALKLSLVECEDWDERWKLLGEALALLPEEDLTPSEV